MNQQINAKAEKSRLLGSLSLVPLMLDPLVPAIVAVLIGEKSVDIFAYGFISFTAETPSFTPANVMPIISFLLGGIAARLHRSLVGAFSCGCGAAILLGRLFYTFTN